MCVSSVAQLCPTLCDPTDCSLPVSSVHGISQARMLEWVAISSSRGTSHPGIWTPVSCISCIGRWFLYHCATWILAGLKKGSQVLDWGRGVKYHTTVQSQQDPGWQHPGLGSPCPSLLCTIFPTTSRAGGACCLLHFMVWGQCYPAL